MRTKGLKADGSTRVYDVDETGFVDILKYGNDIRIDFHNGINDEVISIELTGDNVRFYNPFVSDDEFDNSSKFLDLF